MIDFKWILNGYRLWIVNGHFFGKEFGEGEFDEEFLLGITSNNRRLHRMGVR